MTPKRRVVRTRTPRPDSFALRRFAVLIVPAERIRNPFRSIDTLGDVLDSPEGGCRVRNRWYSADKGKGGIKVKKCGANDCSTCVVPWLYEHIAPAWASWDRADLDTHLNEQAWRWHREKLGIKVSGSNAMPGVLAVPSGKDEVISFVPSDTGIGGAELDELLVQSVRAIPIPPPHKGGSGDPLPYMGRIPNRIPDEAVLELASIATGRRITTLYRWDMTPEENQAFLELIGAW